MKRFALRTAMAAAGMMMGTAATAQFAIDRVQNTNGFLGGSDARDSANRYYDEFTIQLPAGQRVRISASRAEGGDLDPYLEIYGPTGGSPVATDDDSGGYPNARLEFTAGGPGIYRIRVRGYSASSTGPYDLVVEPLAAARSAVPLQLGPVNQGRFDNSSLSLSAGGPHYRDYNIWLAAGEEILLRLDSSDFDSYLYVYRAGEEGGTPLARDDDGGQGLNSNLTFRAPRPGVYTVRASQLGHGDGAYVLRMNRLQ